MYCVAFKTLLLSFKIATDRVAWSDCMSVGHVCKSCKKWQKRSRCCLGATSRGPKEPLLNGVEIPMGMVIFGSCPAHWETLTVYAVVYAVVNNGIEQKGSFSTQ